MAENADKTNPAGGPKMLAGYLASAIDMEDQINTSVYQDYLKPDNWPKNIEPEIFKTITQYISVLIEDTQKHRKIIAVLVEKYARDN